MSVPAVSWPAQAITATIALLVFTTRVMDVIATVSRAERGTSMKTFTIEADTNISAFASKKEAAAASATPFDPFASQDEFADLAAETLFVNIGAEFPGSNSMRCRPRLKYAMR